ncbi:Ig-like virion protein [Nymphon striatum]|nr:Ig-like virion protein [Nymphon striatum]
MLLLQPILTVMHFRSHGISVTGNTAQGEIVSHMYTNVGSYIATLTVNDGLQSDQETTTIIVNNSSPGSNTVAFTDGTSLIAQDNFSGLAMGVIDMNGDGKDDIVQFNSAKKSSYSISKCTRPNFFNFRLWARSNFVDINNDGWADIFACHDDAESRAYQNNQDGTFDFNADLLRTETDPTSDNSGNYASMWIDYDNDNDLDLYISKCRGGVTSSSDPRRINMLWQNDDAIVINHGTGPNLMRNNGDGTFTEVTSGSGLLPTLAPQDFYGIQGFFRDFNNDGHLDLMVSGDNHYIFYNNGDGTFQNAVNPFNSNQIQSFSVGDINHDGFLDLYAGYATGLNSPRTQSNINGIGARVELYGAWGKQIRDVRSGEGYGLVNSYTQHFGIGASTQVDKVVVRWPSGNVDEILNPSTNQFLVIIENSAIPVTSVTVSPLTSTITEGSTQQLTEVVNPTNADNTSTNWVSSNISVATVNSNGLVTAVSEGTATITVSTNRCSILPSNASNQTITWSSSNPSIATVNQNGLVSALSAGSATILATTIDGGFTDSSTITVEASVIGVTGINISPTSANITVGNTQQVTATITPSNADNQTVTWSSNDTSIATIDINGLITAVAAGNTTITATSNDGNFSSNAAIVVEPVSCPDADGDGVCDADDICPGGDDNIDTDGNGTPDACEQCPTIDFNDYTLISYANQDNGPATIQDNGSTLYMTGNAWKAMEINYTITANTVLEFDFKSTAEGEIHEIAFDTDNVLAPNIRIVPFGNQGYSGNLTSTRYSGNQNWQSYTINIGQEATDTNGDGIDDNCATSPCTDTDNDGVCDTEDICEGFNDSLDADNDGVPDGCDTCATGDDTVDNDNDGIADSCDICEGNDDTIDSDNDGVPDGCDTCDLGDDNVDSDNDGIADSCDLCQGGDDTVDSDGDGIPDFCDPTPCLDADNDGVCDADDICPGGDDNMIFVHGGDDNVDSDGDGIPDFCDTTSCIDSDNDGVCDTDDICPGGDDTVDTDGNGIPDACEECPSINFNDYTLISYANQDNGPSTIQDNGSTLYMTGNAWKAIEINYTITANTVLEFDFKSTAEGEIHEIAFDTDNVLAPNIRIVPFGNQGYNGNMMMQTGQETPSSEIYQFLKMLMANGIDDNCETGPCTDSDNDGVCDADDICEGGDDSIDSDGDGIPDFCDTGASCTDVTVNIVFDDYAREVSWQLNDVNGVPVLSGSGYTDADDFASITENTCLPAGCYDFVINDTYGDGICCRYGEGSYTVTDGTGSVLASGGNYASSETTNFCVSDSGSSSGLRAVLPPSTSLTLSPVPADNVLNMDYLFVAGSNSLPELSIFDITGRLMTQKTMSKDLSDKQINVSHFPDGVYMLKLTQGEHTMTKQFVVKH